MEEEPTENEGGALGGGGGNMSENGRAFTMSLGNYAVALGNVDSYTEGNQLNQTFDQKSVRSSSVSMTPDTNEPPASGGYYIDGDANVRGQQYAAWVNSSAEPDTYLQVVGPQDKQEGAVQVPAMLRGYGSQTATWIKTIMSSVLTMPRKRIKMRCTS